MNRNKKGTVIVYVVTAFAVITIIAGVVFSLVYASISFAVAGRDSRQAYLYAKSGIEYAKSVIWKQWDEVALNDFYVYGSIENGMTYSNSNPVNDYEIEVFCNFDTTLINKFSMESVGNSNNATNTVLYDGFIRKGSVPPIGTGSVLGSEVNWYDDDGEISQFGTSYDGTVRIYYDDGDEETEEFINRHDDRTIGDGFNSKRMIFLNAPTSLMVSNNKDITLTADYIYFESDIKGYSNNPHLYLNIRNSTLTGSILKQRIYTTANYPVTNALINNGDIYGLVEFNSITIWKDDALFKSLNGFYFFKDGIDLFSNSLNEPNLISATRDQLNLVDTEYLDIDIPEEEPPDWIEGTYK